MAKIYYDGCFEADHRWPSGVDVREHENGVLATFQALYIRLNDEGNCFDTELAAQALSRTLETVERQFSGIQYYGYTGFVGPDDEVYQQEIASDGCRKPARYEFVADAIGQLNADADRFIDFVRECCYSDDSGGAWVADVLEALHLYEDKIDPALYDEVLSAACEYIEDDELYESLIDRIERWKAEKDSNE
ncbi:MAG: hypothetical protein J6V14_09070 [Clostridia bacterium]|nr:hypothetical protein [Clostridia bacterium]